jgi:methionine sulfoxide reductase heme-binding subunit
MKILSQLDARTVTVIKVAVFITALIPLARLGWLGLHRGLGSNPIEYISRSTGWWTLSFLLITLCVTPLRRWTGWNWLIKLRRALGLLAFFFGTLHLTTYFWLDQFFDWVSILKDIVKRPFITIGFTAIMLMLPLAVTSTNAMVRRLGGRRWQMLHRLVYLIAILGVIHFWWLVKKDIREPLVFASLLSLLLMSRVWFASRKSSPTGLNRVRSQAA